MGVQAIRQTVPLEKKEVIPFTTPASGLATNLATGEVSIITMLAAADTHRLLETQARVNELINFLRQGNFFLGSGIDAVVMIPIDGGKGNITIEAAVAAIVTGNIGVAVDLSFVGTGSKNWVTNSLRQTLDWMNEQDRLTA